MRYLTSTLAASALLVSSTTVHAGGLADEVMEAPVVMEEPMMEEASGSLSPTIIVIGVLAALLLAASLQEDEDEEVEPPLFSDLRLKTDITQIGTAANGLPVYSYRYIGHDALFSGVMAQDVLLHTPEAVVTMPGGLYAVDYKMLGLSMERLN